MITHRELVSAISELTGIPVKTVILHDRNLVEAGIRSQAMRGRGKSFATARDAAALIIAVSASVNVKDSASAIYTYSNIIAINGKTLIDYVTDAVQKNTDTTICIFGPNPSVFIACGEVTLPRSYIGNFTWCHFIGGNVISAIANMIR